MDSLGAGYPITFGSDNEPSEQSMSSVSDPVTVTPALNILLSESSTIVDVPQVPYLDGSGPPAEFSVTAQHESQESETSCVPQPQGSSRGAVTEIEQATESCSEGFRTDIPSVNKGLMD